MRSLIFFYFFFISVISISSQSLFSESDVKICEEKFEYASSKNLAENPIGDIMVEIGKSFLGTDYEAYTLEKGTEENLIIHLTGLDCYTFFEASLVFARCIKKGNTTFQDFQDELKFIRYRNGEISGYSSRLHYSSDWLYENQKMGIVKDITSEIGGLPFTKKINFMSSHPDSYKRLTKNQLEINKIKRIEDEINDRKLFFIPQENIDDIETSIENGDIILITTSIDGLDISHTGIAVKIAGRTHFMHAPLAGKKIEITDKTLSDYVQSIEKHTGIMIARPLNPS